MRTRQTHRPGRSLALAALAACTLGALSPAQAADYPVLRGSQIDDAPPAPEFDSRMNWSGFYVGGGAGVSSTKFEPGNGLQNLANFAYRNTLLGSEVNIEDR
jgi:outer membrane immunogenic protein